MGIDKALQHVGGAIEQVSVPGMPNPIIQIPGKGAWEIPLDKISMVGTGLDTLGNGLEEWVNRLTKLPKNEYMLQIARDQEHLWMCLDEWWNYVPEPIIEKVK